MGRGGHQRPTARVGDLTPHLPKVSATLLAGTADNSILYFYSNAAATVPAGAKIALNGCYLYNYGTFANAGTISFADSEAWNHGEFDMDQGLLKPFGFGAA